MILRSFFRTAILLAHLVPASALLAGPVGAQMPKPAIEVTQKLDWVPVQGKATGLVITPGRDVFALAPDSRVWRWQPDTKRWSVVPGEFRRISIGIGGRPWGVAPDGRVFRFNGLWWDQAGDAAVDIAGNIRNTMYLLRKGGGLAKWNASAGRWDSFTGTAQRLLAVDANGALWAIMAEGSLGRLEAGGWTQVSGQPRAIAIGPGGTIYAVTQQGGLQFWNEAQRRWDNLPVPGVSDIAGVAVGPGDRPWIYTGSGSIYASDLFAQPATPSATGAAPPTGAAGGTGSNAKDSARPEPAAPIAELTSDEPIQFTDTQGTASRLAIGADGSVFALDTAGELRRWSNSRSRFELFPGDLVKIAVAPDGHPWGVNGLGRIFRHDGADWVQVPGTASDLAIGVTGTVIVTMADGTLLRRTSGGQYVTLPGRGQIVAVAPDNKPWTIRADRTMYRCDADPCQRLPRTGKSLSIGPDGSVFATTPDNRLLRYDRESGDWREIPVPGYDAAFVAVGPRGRPWVITSKGRVLASTFFERDESQDLNQALATNQPTTGTGATAPVAAAPAPGTGFTFTKNLRVENFVTGTATSDDISVGPDGTVLLMADNGTLIREFDTRRETFSDYRPPLPETSIAAVVTDPDGRLWALSSGTAGRVYEQRGSTGYQTLSIPRAGLGRDLAISADGSVYTVDDNGSIHRRQKGETSFRRLATGTFRRIAVGGYSDVWALDLDGAIYQLDGSRLVQRADPAALSATDVGGGKDGSIWICDSNTLVMNKWNATNRRFDKTNQTCDRVAVDPDGRPWLLRTSSSGDLFRIR